MSESNLGSAAAAPSAAIVNLIENAAAHFELDRAAARDYLLQAFALIRAQKPTVVQGQRQRSGLMAWQIKRVFAYVDAHLDDTIDTKELAGEVRLSASHFFRSFKASVGMTPGEYITRKRVETAQRLMLTTCESLCQIAAACGLCDQSHLCRVFRRVVGQTPNAWRRAHWTEPVSLGAGGGANA